MVALLFGRKKKETAEPPAPVSKPPRQESSPAMKELRGSEFTWTTFDTNSKKKSGDWYFVLWTIALSGAVAAFLLNNVLFSLFLVIAAFIVSIYASRKPRIVDFKVTRKGVTADTLFLSFSSLTHFYIVEDTDPTYLLLQAKKVISPLYVFPIAEDVDIDALHTFLLNFLEEEKLEVPVYQQLMDRIGF